jgi:hypothetical protein
VTDSLSEINSIVDAAERGTARISHLSAVPVVGLVECPYAM